jgi:hypothetical protein
MLTAGFFLTISFFCFYFAFQSAFMKYKNEHLDTLQDIKKMMERSSRFLSLSGLSGVSAGCCALAGAFFAEREIRSGKIDNLFSGDGSLSEQLIDLLKNELFLIAIITFLTALCTAIFFTRLRSKKTNIPMWGAASKRLMTNVAVPLVAGGLFILKLLEIQVYELISPACLLFYGLALVNASKYTLGEIRYLGYAQLILGVINLWAPEYGIYLWALGFGVLHIIYGIMMWFKYEKQ